MNPRSKLLSNDPISLLLGSHSLSHLSRPLFQYTRPLLVSPNMMSRFPNHIPDFLFFSLSRSIPSAPLPNPYSCTPYPNLQPQQEYSLELLH